MTNQELEYGDAINHLFYALAKYPQEHTPSSPIYLLLDSVAKSAFNESPFTSEDCPQVAFGPIGEISIPYCKFGAIDSLDLFGIDELILYSFYSLNRDKYKKAADMGANIGLHSVVMAKCGMAVDCFEPDPVHAALLRKNLKRNGVEGLVTLNEKAISDYSGTAEFLRIKGNTTSSHLAGSKSNPYGDIDRFEVEVVDIRSHMAQYDLIKMDVEGQEKNIITATKKEDWASTDVMLEIGTEENAEAIHQLVKDYDLHAFPQKNGWRKAESLEDFPTSYKDGTLFISANPTIKW